MIHGMFSIFCTPSTVKVLEEYLFKYRVDVVAIQEIIWIGRGIMEKEVINYLLQTVIRNIVYLDGIIVSKRIKHLVIDFQIINHILLSTN